MKKGIHPFYSKIWDCFRDCLKKSRSYDPTVQFKGSFIITSIMISNRDGLQLLRLFNKKDGACFMNHPLQSKEVELFGDKKWFHIHIDWNSIWNSQIPMSELFLFQAFGNVQWCNANEWFSAKLSGSRSPTWCFNHSSSESKDVYNFDYQLLSLL